MIRIILIVVMLGLLLIAASAVALYHFLGWKGLIAFPFLLLLIIWIAKKIIGKLIRNIGLGLFRTKGAVLEGAAVEVHDVTPVAQPPVQDAPDEEGDDEDAEAERDEPEPDLPEKPQHYFAFEMTISPQAPKCMTLWEPTELVLTSVPVASLEDIEDKTVGSASDCTVWNGSAFVDDEEFKHEGQRRIRLIFEVDPGTRQAHLNYYGHSLAAVSLPAWTPPA